MPETKAPTQAQADRAQEKVIRTLLNFLDHKRKTIHQSGGVEQVLMDIEAYARSLPAGVRPFLLAFLLGILERDRSKFVKAHEHKASRLRDEIEAEESDATPQGEVNAAVRAIFRDADLD